MKKMIKLPQKILEQSHERDVYMVFTTYTRALRSQYMAGFAVGFRDGKAFFNMLFRDKYVLPKYDKKIMLNLLGMEKLMQEFPRIGAGHTPLIYLTNQKAVRWAKQQFYKKYSGSTQDFKASLLALMKAYSPELRSWDYNDINTIMGYVKYFMNRIETPEIKYRAGNWEDLSEV